MTTGLPLVSTPESALVPQPAATRLNTSKAAVKNTAIFPYLKGKSPPLTGYIPRCNYSTALFRRMLPADKETAEDPKIADIEDLRSLYFSYIRTISIAEEIE
jgi:hypothetical protein